MQTYDAPETSTSTQTLGLLLLGVRSRLEGQFEGESVNLDKVVKHHASPGDETHVSVLVKETCTSPTVHISICPKIGR